MKHQIFDCYPQPYNELNNLMNRILVKDGVKYETICDSVKNWPECDTMPVSEFLIVKEVFFGLCDKKIITTFYETKVWSFAK